MNTGSELLAAAAHQLWCERMTGGGWNRGDNYDSASKSHDALRPWGELAPADKQHAREQVAALGLDDRLARAIDYPRGTDRPFAASEMRRGLEVALAPAPGSAEPPSAEIGRVESWTTDAGADGERGGGLESVTVRWADGTTSTHDPAAGELRRPEDRAAVRARSR